ncbi:ABC transporter permease [Idiomarina xiamenensis]|nr:ABC transporter permease [Idiomarina xiamenensis]
MDLLWLYIKVGLRNAKRHLGQSLMSVLGLTLGLFASLTILLYALHESQYDSYHPQADSVYRAAIDLPELDLGADGIAMTPDGLKDFLLNRGGRNIEAATQLLPADKFFDLYHNNYKVRGTELVAADADMMSVFSLPLLNGDSSRLAEPNTLLLSQSLATRLFGQTDVVGTQLRLDNDIPLTIIGVFDDLPDDTHLAFDSIVSMGTIRAHSPTMFRDMRGNNFYTYIRVADEAPLSDYAEAVSNVLSANMNVKVETFFQPLTSIHLQSKLLGELKPGGDASVVIMALALAFGLLLIACFNFINMTTAHASIRAKEVGVRKSNGASRQHLFWQFMVETALLVVLSTLLACALIELSLPMINRFLEVQLVLNSLYWWVVLGLTVLLTFAAGCYPALFIARFDISKALRGEDQLARLGHGGFRKVLVFVQSMLTVTLLVLTYVVSAQIDHIEAMDTGYQRQQVVLSQALEERALRGDFISVKQRLERLHGVASVSWGEQVPTMAFNDSLSNISVSGSAYQHFDMTPIVGVGYNYVETFGMSLLAGRDFSLDFSGDYYSADDDGEQGQAMGMIVTRSFARLAGFDEVRDAVGQHLYSEQLQGVIVGVIDDVIFRAMDTPAQPFILALGYQSQGRSRIAIKLEQTPNAAQLAQINQLLSAEFNLRDNTLTTLTAEFNRLHKQLRNQIVLLVLFTLLIVLLTLLGMLGLAKFSAERRIRELAIRRVIGASKFRLINLLSLDFIKVVALASVLAWPLAWWVSQRWLAGFAYSVEVAPVAFVLASVVTIVLSWITVSTISYFSTLMNPVDALKHD